MNNHTKMKKLFDPDKKINPEKHSDNLTFADEKHDEFSNNPSATFEKSGRWKILIVDDDEDIHMATHLMLDGFEFKNRKLRIYDAHSAEQAQCIIDGNPDIAIILLDVVMETNTAGLNLVKYIREEMKNPFVRIILRTGQPGYAPEEKVIIQYDINDYKLKTELTARKLFTSIIGNLRTYDALMELELLKQNLEDKVTERTAELHTANSRLEDLLNNTLTGSIEAMLDILAVAKPVAFERANRFKSLATDIAKRMGMKDTWETEVACLLSQIGCISVPDDIIYKHYNGKALTDDEKAVFNSHPATAQKFLEHIPGFEQIAKAIGNQLEQKNSSIDSQTDLLSKIIRISNDFDTLERQGKHPSDILKSLKSKGAVYDSQVFEALEQETAKQNEQYIVDNLLIDEIESGVVLADDIVDVKGKLLIPKGTTMTNMHKALLNNYTKLTVIVEPIKVIIKPY